MIKQIAFPVAFLLYTSPSFSQHFISFHDKHISYEGRIAYTPDAAELMWPGTSVTINFKGTGISGEFKDQDTSNYYNVIIDHDSIRVIQFDTLKKIVRLLPGFLMVNILCNYLNVQNGTKVKPGFMALKPMQKQSCLNQLNFLKERLNFLEIRLPVVTLFMIKRKISHSGIMKIIMMLMRQLLHGILTPNIIARQKVALG